MNDIVGRLLKQGARPDVRNNFGYSALMIASQEGNADVVKNAAERRADRTLRNKKRETAADIATASGQPAIAQLLK